MKKLTTLVLTLCTFASFAQVSVKEQKVNVDGNKPGFYVSIPYGNQEIIEKELKDELKSWKGKYANKGYIFVDDCKLKELGKNTFDVFAKVEENPDGGAFVSVAVDLGGAFLSSDDHADQAKIIDKRLHAFGVKAAKSVVGEEIKAEEKVLKEKEKELEGMVKEQEQKQKEIESYQQKIAENEKAIEELKTNQEAKKTEITTQQEKVEAVTKKKEAIK